MMPLRAMDHQARLRWFAREVLPHESDMRKWLAGRIRGLTSCDLDEVVQEAYARIWSADIDAIGNARAYLKVQDREGFDRFLWRYVDDRPLQNRRHTLADVPASTPLSERLSKDLRAEGFRFVGPVIVYAFMQAVGMVNDHLVTCPAHDRAARLA